MENEALGEIVKWAELLRVVVVPLLGYVSYIVRGINKQAIETTKQLQTLNGRMTRVETKLEDHERFDDQRFNMHHRAIMKGER